jgi:hypothetical protein
VRIPIAACNESAGILGFNLDASIQTKPGWCAAPSLLKSHVLLVQHLYLGVFDGHGGAGVADELAGSLHKEIEADGGFTAPAEVLNGLLTKTCLRVDQELCKSKVCLKKKKKMCFSKNILVF